MLRDLKGAARTLAKNPGFMVVAVLTLALGIGANSAVFSVFDQVILQLLPVENPKELVLLEIDGPQVLGTARSDNNHTTFSYPQYRDYSERTAHLFAGVAARTNAPVVLVHGDEGQRVNGEMVSGNFFEVLGVRPERGRLFTMDDDRGEGAHPVAVLGHAFWMSRFGGRKDIIGEKILLNGHPFTVIGVAEREFGGLLSGETNDLYTTTAMRRQMRPRMTRIDRPERTIRYFNLVARLRPGVSIERAEAEMQGVFQGVLDDELAEIGSMVLDQEEYRNRTFRLAPATQGIPGLREAIEKPLFSLAALVGLVLLIACVNVAGLLMARALARRREMALRLALGAGRWAIIRQLLSESMLVALAGGAAGLLLAGWTIGLLDALVDGALQTDLSGRVLAFTFGIAALTGLAFGLVPAIEAARTDLASSLKDQTAGAGSARRHALFRKGTVVVQVALSMLLLFAAGLFVRTLHNLRYFDPGFRTENLLSFAVDPSLSGYDAERGYALYDELLRRLRQAPGVRSVGASSLPVLGHASMGSSLRVEGYQAAEGEEAGTSRNVVSPGYFQTLGIPILLGREFEDRDRNSPAQVAVVNQEFVRRYISEVNPLGRRLSFNSGNGELELEIVGVARDQKVASLREELRPLAYTPYWQENEPRMTVYLQSNRDEAGLGPDVRRVVSEVDANLPVFDMETVASRRRQHLGIERSVALLSAAFAGIATLLAAIGLYGLMAYGVARRIREIGVRMALGAERRHVVGIVLREAVVYLTAGLLIGIPVALGFGRLLESQLFGLSATDPLVLGAAALTLAAAVLFATLIPARRAAKVDPIVALRYE